MTIVALLFTTQLGALLHPPVGGSYEARLNIPLIGSQHVHLLVTAPCAGQITLSGLLNRRSTFGFERSEAGDFTLQFHPDLMSTLQRYRVQIMGARYDATDDCAHCRVVIRPVLFNRAVTLRRMYSRISGM